MDSDEFIPVDFPARGLWSLPIPTTVHVVIWGRPLGGGLDTDDNYFTRATSSCPPFDTFGDFHDPVAMDQSPWSPYEIPPAHDPGDNSHARRPYRSSRLSNESPATVPSRTPSLYVDGAAWHDSDNRVLPFNDRETLAKSEVVSASYCCVQVCRSASFSGTYRRGNLRRHMANRSRENEPNRASWICTKSTTRPAFFEPSTGADGHHLEHEVDPYNGTSAGSCQDCSHWKCGDCAEYHERFSDTFSAL